MWMRNGSGAPSFGGLIKTWPTNKKVSSLSLEGWEREVNVDNIKQKLTKQTKSRWQFMLKGRCGRWDKIAGEELESILNYITIV